MSGFGWSGKRSGGSVNRTTIRNSGSGMGSKVGDAIAGYTAGNRPDWLKALSETEYQTTTTTNRAADWAEKAGKDNVAKLQALTGQGLTAGRTAMERQGDSMTQANVGSWQSGLGQADSMTAAAGQGLPDVDMSTYMNPAMAPVLAEINRQGDINRSRAQQEAAVMGAFGDNMSLRVSEVDAATQRNAGLATAESWDRAVAAFQGDRAAKLAAGNQMAQLAGLRSDMGYRDASEVRGIGERDRSVQQAAHDRELELAKMRTAAISSAPQTTTTEVKAPGPSRAGQELGALIGLAGMGVTDLPGMAKEAAPPLTKHQRRQAEVNARRAQMGMPAMFR